MKTHCDTCGCPGLCDVMRRGTAPCGENAGMSPGACNLFDDLRNRLADAIAFQLHPLRVVTGEPTRLRDIEPPPPPPAEPWDVFAQTSDWDELLREIL